MGRRSENTIIMSVKMVLMSTGILSIAILLSLSMPNLLTFATSHLPSLFSSLRNWLRPPYLYFIINAIIISIAFLHHRHNNHHSPPHKVAVVHHHHDNAYDVISVRADRFSSYDVVSAVTDDNNVNVVYVKDVEVVDDKGDEREKIKGVVVGDDDDHRREVKSTVVERSTWNPPPSPPPLMRQGALKKEVSSERPREVKSTVVEGSTLNPSTSPPPLMRQGALKKEISFERPPASSRFGQHRRPAKPTPSEGGKALKVSKPKKHDTLESTWKAITEGRHVPLNRHLKKSDTWENHGRQIDVLDDSFPSPKVVKKSETFKERTNHTAPPVKLKKEPSLGQDELNRRVEAFINKFNEDMRLQRQ